ncbi:MAG: hypothetical protein A2201_07150 [Alicyclobacillus sp. RIFOXYA1_FULL_53_8]|nr:MAG: hypothetical protein A2201_07150 [Alicyclobacillus sp. RIFOXYA1_FULL_53_8]
MSDNQTTTVSREPLMQLLSDAKVQAALVTALEKLPSIVEHYTELENVIDFAKNVSRDQDSVKFLLEGLQSDLPAVNFNRETLAALLALVDKLPKLVELLTMAEPMVEFAQAVLKDRDSMQNLVHGAEELVRPVKDKVQDGLDIVAAAKLRADADHSPVNVFTVLRLLKDPTVQHGVHFAQAFLAVLAERNAK